MIELFFWLAMVVGWSFITGYIFGASSVRKKLRKALDGINQRKLI